MLYYLVTFVGLFIVATVIAIICYLKIEQYRSDAETAKTQLSEMVTSAEWQNRGAIIGTKQARKSRLKTMVDYLDQMVYLIVGGLAEEKSAEVKVSQANAKVREILEPLARQYDDIRADDPNMTGLIQTIKTLKIKLDNSESKAAATQQRLKELQGRFDDAMAVGFKKEQVLLAEKEKYRQQVEDVKRNYDKLSALLEQNSQQQAQNLIKQRDRARADAKKLKDELLKTQAQLQIALDRMKLAQAKVARIVPAPDREVEAFKGDGKIMLIDNSTKIVHLDIGSDDRVYPGLTFSVYEKNMPIPKDGIGKAEIEVFDVAKTFSAARIIRSQIKRPVVVGDIIANLIWDSDKTNVFVVAGEFDLDDDGNIDYDGANKIKELIEKWGGSVADTISVETDFVVLGLPPRVISKPTFEQMELDPVAMERYEASLQRRVHYKQVRTSAQTLSIPVFNYERFLYFIGYKTQSARPGAF